MDYECNIYLKYIMERKREKIMYLICFLSKLMNMFLVTVHIRIQNKETGVIEGEKKRVLVLFLLQKLLIHYL